MNAFRNILCAIDLDGTHVASITYALEFARLFKSRVHFVYVNDAQAGYRHPTDREDAVALKVKEAVPESLLEDMDVLYAACKGDTAGEIARYVGDQKIDLIIVGHKHRSRIYSSMFDSADVHIIDTLMLPILVIPDK